MKKSMIKTLGVVVVGVCAIGICFFGYRANSQRQYQQRIEYAGTAILKEREALNNLATTANGLFVDEQKEFLRPEITQDEVSKLIGNLAAIKVSADDFGIKENALPNEAKEIASEKKTVTDLLINAEAKLKIQNQVSTLFVEPVSSWTTAENNVTIRDDLKETEIGAIRENLKFIQDGAWKDLVNEYLGFATAQLERVTNLQSEFDAMLKDGQITEAATYEKYLAVLDSISQVRNEQLKQHFTELANTVGAQIGYAPVAPAAETYVEDSTTWYDEGTSYGENTETDSYYY